jgi:hypothetical protein
MPGSCQFRVVRNFEACWINLRPDISDPGAFAALTRRLFLLDKQREKLGAIPEKTPADLPKDVAEKRLRLWPKRRERS